MVLDLIKGLSTAKGKGKKDMFQTGYYALGGFIMAIIVHDIWRAWGLPGGYETLKLGDKDTGIRMDQVYQLGFGMIPAIMEFVTKGKFKHGYDSFGGYALGVGWLNKSELKQMISTV